MEATIKISDTKSLEIVQDENAESPRTWDSLCKIFCFHKKYSLGDEHDYNTFDFKSWDEFERKLKKDYDIIWIQPLYLYDHSGLTVSLKPFGDRFDSGQVGWVFVDKQAVRDCYGSNRVGVTDELMERIYKSVDIEVELYDMYLTGDTYGYKLTEDGEEIDSCWGFYGSDIFTNGMLENLPNGIAKEIKANYVAENI